MAKQFLVPIVLPADPTAPLEAATKQYVDALAGGASSDEVFIGPADPRPGIPNIELWYDTDAPTTPTTPNPLDEVFIGPTDPHTLYPSVELWYDESDNSSGVVSTPYAGTPAPIAATGSPGVSPLWARGDHIHARNSEIFHTEFTADVTITALAVGSAQTVVNPGTFSYDGSPIMLEFFAQLLPPTGANLQILLNLFDGATDLGYWMQCMNVAAASMVVPVHAMRRLTPSVGSHNYHVRAWCSASGTGTVRGGVGTVAGSFAPGFMRATRV